VKLYLTEEGIVRLETGQYTRSAEDYKYAVIRYLRDLSAADKQFKELYDKCRIKIGKTVDGKESATTTNRKQSAYVPPEKTTVAVAQEKGDKPKPVDVVESKESATTVNRKQSAYVPPDKTMTAVVQEKGAMAVGGNLAVGMGDEIFGTGEEFTNFGIGAKFQYNVMTHLRLEGSFTYFFPKTWGGLAEVKLSMWDLSVNAHYLFPIAEKIKVYPLAGVGILGSKAIIAEGYIDTSTSTSEFGFNLGGGIDVKLSQAFIFNAEVKYKIGGTWKRFLISAGIAYRI
jgi:outer membrane protein X